MLCLNALVQPEDGLVDGEGEYSLRGLGVGLPAADLVKHQLDEERKAALGDGLVDDGPLLSGDGSVGLLQPRLDDCGAQLVAQREHLRDHWHGWMGWWMFVCLLVCPTLGFNQCWVRRKRVQAFPHTYTYCQLYVDFGDWWVGGSMVGMVTE